MGFLNNTLNRLAMHKKQHQEEMAALATYASSNDMPSIQSCDDMASQCFFSSLNTGA